MDLTKILSITGKPGLYQLIKTNKTNFIVESFADKKRFPVFLHDQISVLDEISIYTVDEDMRLKDVFIQMYKHLDGKQAIDHKEDDAKLIAFFQEIVPDYDDEQVYPSHIKKIINWYNILVKNSIIDLEEEKEEDNQTEDAEKKKEENVSDEKQLAKEPKEAKPKKASVEKKKEENKTK